MRDNKSVHNMRKLKEDMDKDNKGCSDTFLIVNPSSSSGSTGKGWEDLYTRIKEALGESPEVVFTEKSGDGTIRTRDFLRKGFKRIIAIGGDGTINEVANGFFILKGGGEEEGQGNANNIQHDYSNNNNNQKAPNNNNSRIPKAAALKPINSEAVIGFIPSGTRNVLAKSLNFPEGVMECCHNFVRGRTEKIDVISATVTDPNYRSKISTRIFLNAAEIGFAAEIIGRSKSVRNKVKSRLVSTVAGIVATMPTYQSNLCEVIIYDGREKILTNVTMGVVANGKYLGGGFMAAPKASISDGLLDVVILKDSGSLKMLDELVKIKNGDYKYEGDIFYMQAKKVSIISKERDVTVTVDGEPMGILPATFQVIQNALKINM
jgi:diacylglycerol kinase (ATP)